jgi:predicted nucleotidyltransferase
VTGIILFGSVARDDFSKYSDIDIAIIVNGSFIDAFKSVSKAIYSLKDEKIRLLENNGLYLYISPFIITPGSANKLEPVYFDIADYGIPLFERGQALSDFINDISKIKYSRRFTEAGEVLEWTR